MSIFVSFDSQKDQDSYRGKFTFDPDSEVVAKSQDEVVKKLYNKVKLSIQIEKDDKVLEALKALELKQKNFINISYFSALEHCIAITLYTVVMLLVYITLSGYFTWAEISLSASKLGEATQFPDLLLLLHKGAPIRLIALVIVWSLGYAFVVPALMSKYESSLRENESLRESHTKMLKPLNSLFYRNSYDIKEVLL